MNVILKIKRFNPEQQEDAYFQEFPVTVEPTDRLLDALLYVQHNLDASLAFRRSCAHGVCGSDAMVINGEERLACKSLVKDVAANDGDVITFEPLRAMPVLKDLMVDQGEFFAKYRSIRPFLVPSSKPESGEFCQVPADRQKFDDPTKCILCSSCYSSCPIIQDGEKPFIGPAAAVQAARFVFDNRDTGIESRVDILDAEDGVWPCENHLECTKVCPRGIKVTKCINLLKRELKRNRETKD